MIGALTLNASVGGMNPLAVEIAAREGARILWMPTLDALNHRVTHGDLPAGATPPMWLALQADLDAQGITVDPVPVLDAAGRPLPATREVLSLAARHQLVVATGHLSAFETRAVGVRMELDTAQPGRRGVRGRRPPRHRHPPGVPAAESQPCGSAGTGPAGGISGTLLHHAVHRQVRLGPDGRQHQGNRSRAYGRDH